jgi:alkanesulfonate monooxygenase
MTSDAHGPLRLFSTCPPWSTGDAAAHLSRVRDAAQWSEKAGCTGILIYTDNTQLDPWVLAQVVIEHTRTLCPLVAVQPVYMHPYSVAKLVASLSRLFSRRVYLNMVAGGFTNDLKALGDDTPHDRRYARLVEYTRVVTGLLTGRMPVQHRGEFYRFSHLTLGVAPTPDLCPGILVSGSSAAGLDAARALGATAIKYPGPGRDEAQSGAVTDAEWGIRIGVIARETDEEAWALAEARFPRDRKGEITHQLAMKVSDSQWHRQLSEQRAAGHDVYWLRPFQHYHTMCPYLVGSHPRVAAELSAHVARGCRTVILDVPQSPDDLAHARLVIEQAVQISQACERELV